MRRQRMSWVVTVTVLALALVSCSAVSHQDSTAESVVARYLAALSRGDVAAAAASTDDPVRAARTLDLVTQGLNPSSSAFTVEDVSEIDSTRARFSYRAVWNFGPTRAWDYNATGELRTADGGWRIAWDPTVVHPRLHEGQSIAFAEVAPAGSGVLDRHGQPLMTPQTVTLVNAAPRTAESPAVAEQLAGMLNQFDPTITAASVRQQLATAPEQTTTIIALRERDAAQVQARLRAIPGVTLSQQARLLSVDPAMSSVAFGGLKEAWQTTRDDASGWRVNLREPDGTPGGQLAGETAQSSAEVRASLDIRLQTAAQRALAPLPQQAALVALQPSTGHVLAVAQNPKADTEGPIALTGLYPPGSTFKMITTSAALQAGAATPDTVLPCPGTENIEGRQIPNDDMFDLGAVPLHTAFAHSCNTTLARLAVGLPPAALRRSGLQLGLGVDYATPGLTTVTGSVPVANAAAQRVESAIGQGNVVASPFGMALATATVAAGQIPAPTFLLGQPGTADQTPPPLPAPVSAAVRQMMRETVTSGTATSLNDITGLRGKTGTAQYGDGKHSHGWFVGIDGDLAFAVLVVGGETSAPAVAAAGRFLRPIADAIPR